MAGGAWRYLRPSPRPLVQGRDLTHKLRCLAWLQLGSASAHAHSPLSGSTPPPSASHTDRAAPAARSRIVVPRPLPPVRIQLDRLWSNTSQAALSAAIGDSTKDRHECFRAGLTVCAESRAILVGGPPHSGAGSFLALRAMIDQAAQCPVLNPYFCSTGSSRCLFAPTRAGHSLLDPPR